MLGPMHGDAPKWRIIEVHQSNLLGIRVVPSRPTSGRCGAF